MRSKVTIADVAREARVSTQTVSRVLNNKNEIRPETRLMVQQVIERLGYRPSSVARSLATNRTSTIGLIVPDIGNPFFADVVRGAEDAARERRFHLLLCNTDQMPDREEAALLALEDQRVDGIILCATRLPEDRLTELVVRRQGVVLVGREPVAGAIGAVRSNEENGAMLATTHLVTSGRRNITFLAGRPGGPSHRLRLKGFHQAAKTLGLSEAEAQTKFCVSNPSGGYQAASEVLREHPDVDALICFNDLVAIGALRACLESGARVPEDIHVIGFDDIVLASLVQPPLTTVKRPRHELGARAVQMLLDHLGNVDHERDIVLSSELVVRASAPYSRD
jgi:LacI family transcriptional regulator